MFDGAESVGKVGPVLQRLEMRFREGIVVRRLRSRMCFGDAQVGEQQGYRLRHHRRAAIGVDGELVGFDAFTTVAVAQEALCKRGELAMGNHPADDVSAEDVDDDVDVEVAPFARSEQLRYIPTPELVGTGRDDVWLRVCGVAKLIAAFSHLAVARKNAVHRALRAEVA